LGENGGCYFSHCFDVRRSGMGWGPPPPPPPPSDDDESPRRNPRNPHEPHTTDVQSAPCISCPRADPNLRQHPNPPTKMTLNRWHQAGRWHRHRRRGHDHIQPRPHPPHLCGEAAAGLRHSRQSQRRPNRISPRIRLVREQRIRFRLPEIEIGPVAHARIGGVPGHTPVLRRGGDRKCPVCRTVSLQVMRVFH
jgi:hypothetical protein